MATDNLQCVFVFLLFQMVLIYHWISSWLSVCFMYEGYSTDKKGKCEQAPTIYKWWTFELLHTSDLLTRNIEPKSKIWRKSNCQPDQLFLRLLSFSLLINVPVWPIILCSMPCHPVYCKQFFWMTNPPDLYFDRHNNPLQCWIIQQHFFLETDFKLNYKPMCHNCQGGKKKMSQNSISKVLRQNFLWYGKRYWLHKFKFASKFETLETDVFHLSANLPIWSFQKPSSSIKH